MNQMMLHRDLVLNFRSDVLPPFSGWLNLVYVDVTEWGEICRRYQDVARSVAG